MDEAVLPYRDTRVNRATRFCYFIWCEPYQGRSEENLSQYRKLRLGVSVILQYADVFRKMNTQAPFHLFFDNFFTSIYELNKGGFKSSGTIRENRLTKCPLPTNSDMQKLPRGSYRFKSTSAGETNNE